MSISMSSTTGFGNHSPSQSFSVAGGGGAGAAGGSLSVSSPSSFRRVFAVSSLKSLNRRQNYVLVLDFEKSLVSFHKVRKGKEVKRSFPFAACVKLERGNGGGGGGAAAGGAKGATALVATFGHEPKYKKALFFASTDERELFCNLVHAMIVSGSRAVTLFKGLQQAAQAQTAPGAAAAQPNANAGASAASASAGPAKNGADADGKDVVLSGPDANEVVAGMDFCDFLISFSSAQTQLSHSQALHSTAKAAGGGAGGRGGGGKGSGFDEHDLAIGGGRARANANDPQAAILQFLADNANNAENGAGGASGINGLASSNLISLLNGRLLEGETPVNSSDITYRVECECGGMTVVPLFKRSGGSGNASSASASRAGISPLLAQSASASNGSSGGGSNVEVSSKDGTGVSASSRGLFLLTNYRILYLNYNEDASYAAREASLNFESYAPWNRGAGAMMMPAQGQDAFAAGAGAGSGGMGASAAASTSQVAAGSNCGGGVCTCDADIPLGLIAKVSRSSSGSRGNEGCEVRLSLKDGRKVEFGFDAGARWVEGLVENIAKLAWPKDQSKLFAFAYAYKPRPSAGPAPLGAGFDGWKLYDALADYTRTTLATDPSYRIVTSNLEYKLCASYPRLIMLPQALRDDEIKQIASYRSQSRLPAVVWVHPLTRATLSRCAQPLVGLNRKRSELDEKLVALLRILNPSNPSVIHILDARPWKAAVGNTAMGKGFENIAHYDGATLQFCNIDNIHSQRQSCQKMKELCSYGAGTPSSNAAGGATSLPSTFLSSASSAALALDETFLSKLEGSMWLLYVRLVLAAAQRIAVALSEEGASCITHCSDGWDRTSQLSALAQLMLDPYYRTLEGFAILIEKEWLSFGHRFAERYGHASAEHDDEQRAPIFLQFLDCVFQMLHQFPSSFEFNEEFLIAISDHVASHRFGTFLYNCLVERDKADLAKRTVSLWTFLLHPQIRTKFCNPAYMHPPHVARWSAASVPQNEANMEALLKAARSQAALDQAAAAAGRGASSAPYALHAPAPSCSGSMPAIPPLSSSPSAPIIASYFCIPSVAARRIVLWEKMHLRHDREFLRTQMNIQTQIAHRVNGAAAARMNMQQQQQQEAAAAAATASASASKAHVAPAAASGSSDPAGASSDIEGAWAARYELLKQRIFDAGIDVQQLETTGTVVHTAGAGAGAAAASSPRSVLSGALSSPNASDSALSFTPSASPSPAAASSASPRAAAEFVAHARMVASGSPLAGPAASPSPPPPVAASATVIHLASPVSPTSATDKPMPRRAPPSAPTGATPSPPVSPAPVQTTTAPEASAPDAVPTRAHFSYADSDDDTVEQPRIVAE